MRVANTQTRDTQGLTTLVRVLPPFFFPSCRFAVVVVVVLDDQARGLGSSYRYFPPPFLFYSSSWDTYTLKALFRQCPSRSLDSADGVIEPAECQCLRPRGVLHYPLHFHSFFSSSQAVCLVYSQIKAFLSCDTVNPPTPSGRECFTHGPSPPIIQKKKLIVELILGCLHQYRQVFQKKLTVELAQWQLHYSNNFSKIKKKRNIYSER